MSATQLVLLGGFALCHAAHALVACRCAMLLTTGSGLKRCVSVHCMAVSTLPAHSVLLAAAG